MRLNEETTWPSELLDYLELHKGLFLAWELKGAGIKSSPEAAREIAREYDCAVYGLRAVLNRHTLEGAYHCTRLTKSEIRYIRGLETNESVDHEDRAKHPIPASNIQRIIQFPDADFVRLTKCDSWKPLLL